MKKEFYLFNNKNQKHIRKELRKSMPESERLLWYKLRNKNLGYRFRRQYSIKNYVVDFYCPKLKLAIEVDGWTHDFIESTKYDKKKTEIFRILRNKNKKIFK